MKKIISIILFILIIIIIITILSVFIINSYIIKATKNKIITIDKLDKEVDAIIILGCKVKEDATPSDMLKDRLETGINVYNKLNTKILMSGDHGRTTYDEVNIMKKYAINKGIKANNIFMDHAGFSTYESMYRAKEIFKIKKAIIITQEYHLYRALYIADKLGIEAYGVSADLQTYIGQSNREIREILARFKDYIKTIYKPKPTYLGETIPITGDGNITNDK